MNLLAHEFARLRRGRLALRPVTTCASQRLLLRHLTHPAFESDVDNCICSATHAARDRYWYSLIGSKQRQANARKILYCSPMPRKKPPLLPRPLDFNEEAFRFVRGVTGEPVEDAPVDHAAAAELGRRGGKTGGKARASALSAKKRSEI